MSKSRTTTMTSSVVALRRAPTHPGAIFRHDYREALVPPLTQAAAAARLGWSTNRMNEFEMGKRGVTAENALALAELVGTTPEFWMHLQTRYDLWQAFQARKQSA